MAFTNTYIFLNGFFCFLDSEYIALQGTRKEPLPQVKLGETLNLRFFGVYF